MAIYGFEFIGTFFLILTIALTGNPIAIGFMLVALLYAGGSISGAHYNPAVTLALLLRKKITSQVAKKYIISQFAGGIAACLLSSLVFTAPLVVEPQAPWVSALIAEVMFTFLLVTTVLHVAATKKTAGNQYFGLAIGGVVLASAFAVGKISGGALNPVVGIAPLVTNAVLGRELFDPSLFFLYIIGPLTGSFLASLFHQFSQHNA